MENLTPDQNKLLLSHPCIAAASPENRKAIAQSAYIKVLNKGQYLQHRGGDAIGYYGIFSGKIKVSAMSSTGKALTLKYLQAGDWFGEISLLDGIARTHDCEATQVCQVIIIPKLAFETHIMNDLDALKAITRQLCQRVRTAMNLAEQATIQPLPERLANRLLELQNASKEGLNINQQDIAHMLGVSRQSVSKLLLQWAELGWIKLEYHQVSLLKPDKLKSICMSSPVPQG
ncbi:Crp/Fnr family transcriptional regulator [Oceaniserpentilla sp. 4NH20-0058]|uniref:Crp/Fnr family transcriptional regulator n=1 Tax=Oceaniserpentilla sp. 4NH20-0058 TaxID=3127660 RepID=UPI00310B61DE